MIALSVVEMLQTEVWRTSEGRGLTRPAIGVGSLLIFFTRPGLMELSNLTETTEARRHHKRNFIQGNAFKLQMIISYVAS